MSEAAAGQRNWWESPFERRSVQRGMWVWTEDGQRLGRVSHMTGAALEVRPRPRAHVCYRVPVADIVGLTADRVRVRGPATAYELGPERSDPATVSAHTLPIADTPPH